MAGGFFPNRARILAHAGPGPLFWLLNQPGLDQIQMDVFDFFVVFLDGPQQVARLRF